MIVIIKTFTYLIIDISTHSVVIYFAARLFGFRISVEQTGMIGIVIEVCETASYFVHEKMWERILRRRTKLKGGT